MIITQKQRIALRKGIPLTHRDWRSHNPITFPSTTTVVDTYIRIVALLSICIVGAIGFWIYTL